MPRCKNLRGLLCALCLLLIAVFCVQTATFAWLSTALRSGTFSVKSSGVSEMSAELWVNAYTSYADKAQGWYVDEIEESTSTASRFGAIGTFNSDRTVFTPASPISLHFGTINNLAQEQENQPIYLKFTISLKPRTSNTVILTYQNDAEAVGGQYLSVYSIDFSQTDPTTGEYPGNKVTDADTLATLNDIASYPFLRFHYFVSTTNYEFTPGCADLSEVAASYVHNGATVTETADFPALFETENNPNVVEYTREDEASHSILFENTSGYSQMTYIYVKINVRPDTLSEALTNSDLKNYMPAYLLFSVVLGMEIRTTAYNSAS